MKTALAVTVILLLTSAGAVQAQFYNTANPFDAVDRWWSIHGGAAFLSGDTEDDVEPIIGIERAFPAEDLIPGVRGAITFSFDYLPVSQPTRTTSLVPILINYKKGSLAYERYRLFGGLGLGVYWASEDIPAMQIDDGFNFAWNAVGGINLSTKLFIQVRWIAGSNPSDDGILTTELGYRF